MFALLAWHQLGQCSQPEVQRGLEVWVDSLQRTLPLLEDMQQPWGLTVGSSHQNNTSKGQVHVQGVLAE